MRSILLFLFSGIIFSSCQVTVKKDEPSDNTSKSETNNSSSKIRNGILLNENGLKVSSAYLSYEDGSLVSNENSIDIGKKVIMHLKVSEWKVIDGKVYLGAGEKVSTSEGDVFLDEKDLFTTYDDSGVSAEDAESITLSAVITQVSKIFDYFLVEFKVWDKRSNNSVSGSYKLYMN